MALSNRHCARSEAIQIQRQVRVNLDCFAALAMTNEWC